MATILELYNNSKPDTARANEKGKDTTPIGTENPRGEFSPSNDLAKDEDRLRIARGGQLRSQRYSDSVLGDR